MAKVLITDDSKFMRLTLRKLLEGTHEVIGEAETDVEAVEKYKELKPDIVMMDITIPIESGLRAVREIILFDPAAKIIMVSAMGQENIVEEALSLGAKGFITKPAKKDILLAKIEEVLK